MFARECYVENDRSDKGVGDVVFSDHRGERFLIVEVKHLNPRTGNTARVSRNDARQKVRQQAEFYGKAWTAKHPGRRV